ncbi:transmembrane protein-like protein 66 [Cadophora sp. MPI-SDFR-AT-0126]|nr:transmembrane protein-like protein 66 [Leotiomycetes sp. MPI-SDFR-AT-0126]
MQLLHPLLLFLLTLTTPSPATAAKKPKDAILLSSVKTLTLRSNALTSHRRVSAIPQLKCVGPACKHHNVDRMRCTNQGASYNEEDIEWSCVADMPSDFKLGSTEVICEGYANRDDPYVLKGSCGVEYRLLLTEQGEERFGKSGSGWTREGNGEGGSGLGKALFMLVFLGVLFWIIYSAWQALPAGGLPRQPRRGWGGGWGGGGWGGGPGGGDPYDPPPPYPGKRYSTQQEGWRPGFWSGAAAGAAGGYMAGSRGNRQQEAPRGNSWFGGNSGGGYNSPSPARSSSGSSSSARHSSTGFGSTSRR